MVSGLSPPAPPPKCSFSGKRVQSRDSCLSRPEWMSVSGMCQTSVPHTSSLINVSFCSAAIVPEVYKEVQGSKQRVKMLTEERDLLSDSIDVYDGPQRTADAQPAVEEDGLSVIDAVENSPVAIGPE